LQAQTQNQPEEKAKNTIQFAANITMPFWAAAFKGGGFELQANYGISKQVALCLAAGMTNYANMGLSGSKNTNSYGHHLKLGIGINPKNNETATIKMTNQFSFYWANTNEVGIWNTATSNTNFWQTGYGFDVWRQAWGMEYALLLGGRITGKHELFFKNFYNIMGYEEHYFPLSSISGAGYLLAAGKNMGFAWGLQFWYVYKLQ
jgi:hypothetical protein